MQNKKQKLIEITGFSDKKAKVYLALLESGETSVGEIAKRSGLKRTTVYNLLPELKQDGYVKSTIQNGKRYFFVDDFSILEKIVEDKMSQVKELIPLLKANYSVLSTKPKIILYEGVGGMNQLYQEIIHSVNPGDTILTYIGTNDFDNYISEETLKKYVKQRKDKKVRNKILMNESDMALEWKREAQGELREMKILSEDAEIFNGDLKIFNNKIALISYKENFFGVIIESGEISKLLKNMFNLIWKSA